MVDGVLASCYGLFDHDMAHLVMKPTQWIPNIMDLVFDMDSLAYVHITRQVSKWLLPIGQFK